MMMNRTIAILLFLGCAAALPTASAAQHAFGASVDLSVGVFAGAGRSFVDRGGPALDGIAAIPLGRTRSGMMVAGLTGGISGPLVMSDLICRAGPNDTCVPNYPTFVTVGAVAGVQRALGSGTSARALAGPAYFRAVDGDDTFGLQGRLDVAKSLIFRTAVVASVRGSFLPRFEGQTLSYATFGLGLRIQ
jgi:hypothetical protein